MKVVGLIATLALWGCAGAQSNSGSETSPEPLTYQAHGMGWKLTIKRGIISLRETAGRIIFDYHGQLPSSQAIDGGIRYQGELLRYYVIGGLVEEDVRPYSLTIIEKPCTDSRGRIWVTSVSLDFQSDYRPTGCGGALPRRID